MKRQLSKEEREICRKQIGRMEKRNKKIEYLVKYNNLMIDGGLRVNFEEQMRNYVDELDTMEREKNTIAKLNVIKNFQ